MKKFILGFITGGVICAAVTGFAVEYAVSVNPFPITVNGSEATIEGYNINDSTYFKLRDISAAVGGFEVGFADNTIAITTADAPAATPVPTSEKTVTLPDVEVRTVDGVDYVRDTDVENMLKSVGITKYTFGTTSLIDTELKKKVIKDIPLHPTDVQLIQANFYYSTIVPYIESH
ncbi:MAG: hypothetical protein IJG06_01285 [Clostridia bacterium]|nr:hypothetical protein [Clostridia bacterium]MBQ9598854.1 hypothetical protein [Clostridia bacterium]MBR0470743.1 hypothetical protein [Clostridia bacterium]